MRSGIYLAAFVSVLLALAAPAEARGTLDSILPEIRAAHPGRLSDAQPYTDPAGRLRYRIKWMTPEGRIIYFDADPRTGRFTGAGGDEGNQWRDRPYGVYGDRHYPANPDPDHPPRNRFTGDGDGSGNWPGDWRGRGGRNGGDWHGRGGGNWGGDWHGGSGDNGRHGRHGGG